MNIHQTGLRRLTATAARKQKGSGGAGAVEVGRTPPFLLERRGNVAERRADLGAEAVHCGDDRKSDAGGNQRVFNRGRPRLILRKASKKVLHLNNSMDTRVAVERGPEFCPEYIRRTRPDATVGLDN